MNAKLKSILINLIFWVIALLSLWIIIDHNKNFSLYLLIKELQKIPVLFIILSTLCMFLYIFFEAKGLQTICNFFKHPINFKNAFTYASADIYFSAVTPSATGGQPAAFYFMKKDGVPTITGAIALMLNVTVYTICAVLIGILTLIIFFPIFIKLNLLSKLFIVIGFIFNIAIIILLMLFLIKRNVLEKLLSYIIKFLSKLHLLNEKRSSEKLKHKMEEYSFLTNSLKNDRKMLKKVFLWNFLQKFFQTACVVFIYLGLFNNYKYTFDIWAIQCLASIGAYSIPIPGGIGTIDYILLNGFNLIMSSVNAINIELLDRAFSFYFCIIICGIISMIKFIKLKRSSEK